MPASSRHTPNPVRALLGRGSIYTLALGLQLSASLVTIPIATRLLRADEYGVIALALLVALVIGAVSTGGLNSVISRVFFDETHGPAQSRRLMLVGGGLAVGCALLAELSSPLWIPALGGEQNALALHIAVWATVPAAMTALSESYLRAAERAGLFVCVTVLAGVGGQVVAVALVAALPHSGASTYMAGVAAGYALAAVTGLFIIKPWRDGFASRTTVRSSLALGIPLIPWGLAWTILALGDRAIIQSQYGATDVGRYQIAYTFGALSLTLVSTVASAWTPIVFGAAAEQRWRVHGETLAAILILAALVASALALAGPLILRIATPPSYHAARLAGVVALVTVSALPWAIYASENQILLWHKRTLSLAWITPVAAGVNLALVAILLGPLGLEGAGLATLLAYSLLAVLVHRAARPLVSVQRLPRRVVVTWALALALAALGGTAPVGEIWLGLRLALIVALGVWFVVIVRQLTVRRRPDETSFTSDALPAGAGGQDLVQDSPT